MTTQTQVRSTEEALNRAKQKIESAMKCHPNAVPHLLGEAWDFINEALAQPEQEKERCVGCEACIDTACGRDECPKGWPKAAQPEQEPVAWIAHANVQLGTHDGKPPQRPSRSDIKPLTDEQIDAIADKFTVHTGEMWEPELCIEFNDSCKSVHSFARAIEAAHGIKE